MNLTNHKSIDTVTHAFVEKNGHWVSAGDPIHVTGPNIEVIRSLLVAEIRKQGMSLTLVTRQINRPSTHHPL